MRSDDEQRRAYHGRLDAIFRALPRLGSPEYLENLRNATAKELPPQVLVRAFRQLQATHWDAAQHTLARLLGHGERYGYLSTVRRLARRHLGRYDRANEVDDLVGKTVERMLMALPGSQGAFAERAWVQFCRQQFFQAWRDLYGREGHKAAVEIVEPVENAETGEIVNPAEETDASDAPWHTGSEEADERLRARIHRERDQRIRDQIATWEDPALRTVSIDQFLEDPSAISGSRARNGKPPLTDQLGLNRDQVNRLRTKARIRLKTMLLSENWMDVDPREALVTRSGDKRKGKQP